MKKILAVILTLTLILALTACGGKNNDGAGAPDDSIQTPAEPSPAPEPLPETDPEPPAGQGEEPEVPDQSGEPAQPAEPQQPEEEPILRVSHEDVTLRSAGESFRLTVWDSSGNDPDACTYTSADPAVAAVDESGGEITAVAAWSDYAAGYLAVQQAVRAVREQSQELEPLSFSIVRGEDIYAPENQKLLFPVTS